MIKYNIVINSSVKLQLDNHIRFAAKISSKFAKSIRNDFAKILLKLHKHPKRHPLWLPNFELPNSYHKVIIKKRYLILFYIHNNNIFVDYLLDCRMDNNITFNSLFSSKI